jgi:hypothetical protein
VPNLRSAHGTPERPEASRVRIRRAALPALLAGMALLSGAALAACGGTSVSDAVPKSTPDITPPTDTSAEKAAVQTTSTSTTSTKTTSTTGEGTSTSEGGTGEAAKEPSKEASSEVGAAGGAAAEKEKEKAPSSESSKGGEPASPTGGASAP